MEREDEDKVGLNISELRKEILIEKRNYYDNIVENCVRESLKKNISMPYIYDMHTKEKYFDEEAKTFIKQSLKDIDLGFKEVEGLIYTYVKEEDPKGEKLEIGINNLNKIRRTNKILLICITLINNLALGVLIVAVVAFLLGLSVSNNIIMLYAIISSLLSILILCSSEPIRKKIEVYFNS